MSARVELILYSDAPIRWADLPEPARVRTLEPPRPLGDTHLHGDDAAAVAHLAEARHASALSVAGSDLDAAQAAAADIVEQALALSVTDALAGGEASRLTLLDVLALDARDATAAVERLRRRDPSSRLWIGIRADDDGLFRLETFGLRKLGACEVHVPCVAEADLGAVSQFLNKLAHHAATTGVVMGADHRVSFGWVDVCLRAAARVPPRFIAEAVGSDVPGVLEVYEPASDDHDAPLTRGACRAAALVNQLTDACHRCGIDADISVPRAAASAVVCRRVPMASLVHARRVEPHEPSASGWVVVCGDDHDHEDPASFVEVTLSELCAHVPRLFSMLAAPIGTGISTNDAEELVIDLGSP